jgi:hypothetical protein
MISDADLAQLCAATYADPPTLPVPMAGTDARITVMGDVQVVAFRGSVTAGDWARDFICLPVLEKDHPQLGLCHVGFLDGANGIMPALQSALADKPVIITGHSLGGALALGVGALLACMGKPPLAIVTFGSPRFGGGKFVDALASIDVRQYRRGNDPVPMLPFDVPPLFTFLDVHFLIAVGQAQRDPFACHSILGYCADVAAYLKLKATLTAA